MSSSHTVEQRPSINLVPTDGHIINLQYIIEDSKCVKPLNSNVHTSERNRGSILTWSGCSFDDGETEGVCFRTEESKRPLNFGIQCSRVVCGDSSSVPCRAGLHDNVLDRPSAKGAPVGCQLAIMALKIKTVAIPKGWVSRIVPNVNPVSSQCSPRVPNGNPVSSVVPIFLLQFRQSPKRKPRFKCSPHLLATIQTEPQTETPFQVQSPPSLNTVLSAALEFQTLTPIQVQYP